MKEVKRYYTNGQISQHYYVDKNNKIQGEYKYRYSNGQIWVHCFFKNDLKEGEYKNWYKDGQLKEHCFYHKDNIIDISEYVTDIINITKEEYFLLQITFGYFPIIKYDNFTC